MGRSGRGNTTSIFRIHRQDGRVCALGMGMSVWLCTHVVGDREGAAGVGGGGEEMTLPFLFLLALGHVRLRVRQFLQVNKGFTRKINKIKWENENPSLPCTANGLKPNHMRAKII